MSGLNAIEREVLKRFLMDPALVPVLNAIDIDAISVRKRSFTGIGFLTDVERDDVALAFLDSRSERWGKVGARLNKEKLETGYLVYVDGGYLTGIEGFTYGGEEWPADIETIELYTL